jgi:hypothetical protein
MARYQVVDRSPRLLPVDLGAQLVPGRFEHALDHLVDNEIDLTALGSRFVNDDTGAPAYDPAMRRRRSSHACCWFVIVQHVQPGKTLLPRSLAAIAGPSGMARYRSRDIAIRLERWTSRAPSAMLSSFRAGVFQKRKGESP